MVLINNFITLFVESAPWLMLGFLVAGLMKVLVPQALLAKHLGEPGFISVVKAALLGAPLPLCSCGVIPAALGLRRAGASKASTTSFLISTPETGADSVAISYALLGPFMAVIRPIAAITSAIMAGLLVGKDSGQEKIGTHEEGCCASADAVELDTIENGFGQKLFDGLRFSFIDIVNDIAIWLLIGLAMAAFIQTFVPQEFLTQWGDGLVAFIVMALIGVPMYICATASTPLAAGLLFSGVSPGAVLVFMLVGPATNMATVGMVKAELGGRALMAYLSAVIGVGFAFGFGVNWAAKSWQLDFQVHADHAHQLTDPVFASITAVMLAVLIISSLMRNLVAKIGHDKG